MIEFGRGTCDDQHAATRREWLVTNGIGGFASGSVSGILTRRYHGWLVAALDPPLGRTLLVAKGEERVTYYGRTYELGANEWAGGTVAPQGFIYLDRFHLDGTVPVWTYACGDALLEKRVWMEHGANTTYVQYAVRRARSALDLTVDVFASYRDYHGNTHAGDEPMAVTAVAGGVQVVAFDGATPCHVLAREAEVAIYNDWYRDYYLAVEAGRGLDATDDHFRAAAFTATLEPGATWTLVCSTEAEPDLDGEAAYERHLDREQVLTEAAGLQETPAAVQHLVLAAGAFIVARKTTVVDDGRSVIAGYPWFGDWGRDTMIALPGLTLATGRYDVAARILRTFAHYVDRGMIPNRFPDAADTPDYNTIDATLWFIEAIRAYVKETEDEDLLADLFPVLKRIVRHHLDGTRYHIHVDPDDGLLYGGEPGVQLTWMDAKVEGWVVTPRIGKPVEINALWYHALRCMRTFADRLGNDGSAYTVMADQVNDHFDAFWNAEREYCYDVIGGPDGNDDSLRPNQLFAVSLEYSPLAADRQKAVVDACAAHLLTPLGLRSLVPHHPDYRAYYEGDLRARDGAYHQGTVWSWLMGPFVRAHLRVYGDPDAARSYLDSLLRHLHDHGVGSISEIFDGDPPHTPRGTPAQAWSVAECLAAWVATHPNRD